MLKNFFSAIVLKTLIRSSARQNKALENRREGAFNTSFKVTLCFTFDEEKKTLLKTYM